MLPAVAIQCLAMAMINRVNRSISSQTDQRWQIDRQNRLTEAEFMIPVVRCTERISEKANSEGCEMASPMTLARDEALQLDA
ncbi:hypothetical protein E3N88_36615 [Mikania micrantha]|uniref:Uncharacterized protein n=1 Tax=Mikania micrantha TaxID=192012 RepID=A0A5N6M490_9ASTR|nr:hypothetical protein E3N88_36615 [Mikania micrantha]